MTIRQYIVRRTNWSRGVMFAWMLGIMVLAAIEPAHWHGPSADRVPWFFASLAVALALIALIYWRTRCPRCGNRFRRDAWFAQRSKFWSATYDRCAHCGVSLDEPM